VNILNKQLQTADKRWSSSLGVGRGADNSSLSNERGTRDLVLGMLGACIGKVYLQHQPGNWLDIN